MCMKGCKRRRLCVCVAVLAFMFLFVGCESTKPEPTMVAGDVITFGVYRWYVLDVGSDRALIVSHGIIERERYHDTYMDIVWAESDIRTYLNETFYLSFGEEDRERICEVTNENLNNQWYDTEGGEQTIDHIFLLSIAEVIKYFGDSGEMDNSPSELGIVSDYLDGKRIAKFKGAPSRWWLRSPGSESFFAATICAKGNLDISGTYADVPSGIRPALWIKL